MKQYISIKFYKCISTFISHISNPFIFSKDQIVVMMQKQYPEAMKIYFSGVQCLLALWITTGCPKKISILAKILKGTHKGLFFFIFLWERLGCINLSNYDNWKAIWLTCKLFLLCSDIQLKFKSLQMLFCLNPLL